MNICLVNVLEFEPVQEFLRGASEKISTPYPPMGLLTLTAVLEKQGHNVEVIDFANLILGGKISLDQRTWLSSAEFIAGRAPDVVGFSSRCDNYLQSLRIAENCRNLLPRTPIIFGGPQATITDRRTLEAFPFVDCVVRHEAELSLPSLLNAIQKEEPWDLIPGIVYRKNGEIAANPDPPLILDLDQVPVPAFEHFPIETLRTMPIEVGRGCPFGCTFCVTNRYFNRRYRLKSAARIVDEVLLLQEKYGFTSFNFIHDMLTASRPMVLELCKTIKERKAKFDWFCSARTDCVDRDLLETMVDAGCRDVYFGIETGSQRMQKVVNKNLKLDDVLPVVDLCADLGLATTTSFITGFPEEIEEDVEQTLRMMLLLSNKASVIQLHLYCPTPGTPLNDKFSDRLIYTGYVSDFGFATTLGNEDRDLVISNPDIFTNYFQINPLYLDVDTITGLDAFGYCMQSFKYFFYYLVHEPGTPSLFSIWRELRRWTKTQGISWDIETYLRSGLTWELEQFLRYFLNTHYLSPLVTEAFNLDLVLLRLGKASSEMPAIPGKAMRELSTSTYINESEAGRLRLRSPLVCTEVCCNVAIMLESLRTRKYIQPAMYEVPRKVGVYLLKDIRRKRQAFAFVELTDVVEAILEGCEKGLRFSELPAYAYEHCERGGQSAHHFHHLCRRTIQRLLQMQLLSVDEEDAGAEEQWPGMIHMETEKLASSLHQPMQEAALDARKA